MQEFSNNFMSSKKGSGVFFLKVKRSFHCIKTNKRKFKVFEFILYFVFFHIMNFEDDLFQTLLEKAQKPKFQANNKFDSLKILKIDRQDDAILSKSKRRPKKVTSKGKLLPQEMQYEQKLISQLDNRPCDNLKEINSKFLNHVNTKNIFNQDDNLPRLDARFVEIEQQAPTLFISTQRILAAELKSKFKDTLKVTKDCKKYTNIPKFIFKIVVNLMKDSANGSRYSRWIESLCRRFSYRYTNDNKHNCSRSSKASRFSLLELLQTFQQDSRQRKYWKRKHRELLQHKLIYNRRDLILANSAIPDYNKVHYLYCCRVYEWRLNCESRLGHLS